MYLESKNNYLEIKGKNSNEFELEIGISEKCFKDKLLQIFNGNKFYEIKNFYDFISLSGLDSEDILKNLNKQKIIIKLLIEFLEENNLIWEYMEEIIRIIDDPIILIIFYEKIINISPGEQNDLAIVFDLGDKIYHNNSGLEKLFYNSDITETYIYLKIFIDLIIIYLEVMKSSQVIDFYKVSNIVDRLKSTILGKFNIGIFDILFTDIDNSIEGIKSGKYEKIKYTKIIIPKVDSNGATVPIRKFSRDYGIIDGHGFIEKAKIDIYEEEVYEMMYEFDEQYGDYYGHYDEDDLLSFFDEGNLYYDDILEDSNYYDNNEDDNFQQNYNMVKNNYIYNNLINVNPLDKCTVFGRLENSLGVENIIEYGTFEIEFISKYLGIDLTKIKLQNQIHLLNFLFKSDNSKKIHCNFKNALNNIKKEEDKYNFLNTFLACSEDLSAGNKIIELSKQEGSNEIFKMYSELVNLQSEIKSENVDLITFLKVILKKGKNLLLEDFKNVNKDDFIKLVKSGALIKGLYKGLNNGELMGISEFNNISSGYTLELVKGGNLLENTDTLAMMEENNYKFIDKLSKKDFEFVISSIKEAHKNYDPNFINFAIKYMPIDFNNQNSNFIFLRDENKDLVGVCKIEVKEDGNFYYGTHYLKEELRGDFSLRLIIQKILEKELNINGELNGFTILGNNETILRQIEFLGGIGNEIKTYELEDYKSKPFLGFLLNSKKTCITKNKDLKTEKDFKSLNSNNIKIEIFDNIYDENFTKYCKSAFNNGYSLTRIIQENGKFLTIFENIN